MCLVESAEMRTYMGEQGKQNRKGIIGGPAMPIFYSCSPSDPISRPLATQRGPPGYSAVIPPKYG